MQYEAATRNHILEECLIKLAKFGGSDGKASACNVGDLGQEDPLEKEMATHSSTLAWKIP